MLAPHYLTTVLWDLKALQLLETIKTMLVEETIKTIVCIEGLFIQKHLSHLNLVVSYNIYSF